MTLVSVEYFPQGIRSVIALSYITPTTTLCIKTKGRNNEDFCKTYVQNVKTVKQYIDFTYQM